MTDVWETMLELALDASRAAGRMVMQDLPLGRWRGEGVQSKAGRELVSRVDRASEAYLVKSIRDAFPDHAVHGEEGGEVGDRETAPFRWILDPLDGTTNYLHGHPMFAISIAVERLAPKTQEPADLVVAVVHLPYIGDTFFALRGEGSFLNSRSIRLEVSATDELDDALVATGFAYDRERFDNYDNFVKLARDSRGIRRCGSAAIDLAFVAAGRYDAFWELGLRSHDVAAGALLVREAGGRVGDFTGGDDWLEGSNVIATNGRLFDALAERLAPWPPESG